MGEIINLNHQKSAKAPSESECNAACGTVLKEPINWSPEPEVTTKQASPMAPFKPSPLKKIHLRYCRLKSKVSSRIIRPVRRYFYRLSSRKLLGELVVLSTRLNKPDFHVMVELSGHVDRLRVFVYPKGFDAKDERDGEVIYVLDDYLPGYKTYGKMKPRDIKEVMKLLVAMSKLSHTGG